MKRLVAFLRAINVGGHVVKMEDLRKLFESQGFANVETFIASGNVLFDSPSTDAGKLEVAIGARLQAALGYAVATFIRTPQELKAITAYRAFPKAQLEAARALNIAFLAGVPQAASVKKVMELRTTIDDFKVHGRELYWLCRNRQSESTFSNAVLEKTLGQPSTLRGAATIQKIADKF
jgi:uncharacterized protein (DUF1697 family)